MLSQIDSRINLPPRGDANRSTETSGIKQVIEVSSTTVLNPILSPV
jgi:hypothetical protein